MRVYFLWLYNEMILLTQFSHKKYKSIGLGLLEKGMSSLLFSSTDITTKNNLDFHYLSPQAPQGNSFIHLSSLV